MRRKPAASERLFGINVVESSLASVPERITTIWIDGTRQDRRLLALVERAKALGISIQMTSRKNLDRRVPEATHQGVLAEYRPLPPLHEDDLPDLIQKMPDSLFLVLDGVTDPHNLGACMRSAAAVGVQAVIAPRDRSASLTPVVRKVASGAAERIPYVAVTNLVRALQLLKNHGIWIVGMVDTAEQSIYSQDLSGPTALVLGSEGDGLRHLTRETCDRLAHIPMSLGMQSLNVSVAAGVCLFEVVRQRGLVRVSGKLR